MTPEELLKLIEGLYECSVMMNKISPSSAKVLLDMAATLINGLDENRLSCKEREEIDSIKRELLDD